jgi:outer membrane immunogenic protein
MATAQLLVACDQAKSCRNHPRGNAVKKLHLALALFAISTTPSFAADMRMPAKVPPPIAVPLFTWTGFYIGVNGGYGGDRFSYQVGNWVFGVEGDIQASDIKGEISATVLGLTATTGSKIDWFATARGRLGYAWDRVLVYGTGGYAYADVDTGGTIAIAGGGALATNVNTSHNGWVAGAGVEYAFTNNLTFKTEYQYLDFERKTIASAGVATFIDVRPTVHTVRGGLNWKF